MASESMLQARDMIHRAVNCIVSGSGLRVYLIVNMLRSWQKHQDAFLLRESLGDVPASLCHLQYSWRECSTCIKEQQACNNSDPS
eukprot:1141337-Pelagomonas_calceolata.AAC.4